MAIIKCKNRGDVQIGKPTPAWMLTYADMVTQLLIFFVLLFSISEVSAIKFGGYFKKTQKAPILLDEQQLRDVMLILANYAEKNGLEDAIQMEINERGLSISLTEKLMFESGSADILPQAIPILNEIVDQLNTISNDINVEGHTDTIPISNERYGSNWELSTARATNVVRYFVQQKNISPARISASGYAEFHPVATNSTPEGRAANRRVVLNVIRRKLLPDVANKSLRITDTTGKRTR